MNSLVKVNSTSLAHDMAYEWTTRWKAWTKAGIAAYRERLELRNATMSTWERWMTGKIDVEQKVRWANYGLRYTNLAEKIAAIELATRETNVKVYIEADVYAAMTLVEEYFGQPYEI